MRTRSTSAGIAQEWEERDQQTHVCTGTTNNSNNNNSHEKYNCRTCSWGGRKETNKRTCMYAQAQQQQLYKLHSSYNIQTISCILHSTLYITCTPLDANCTVCIQWLHSTSFQPSQLWILCELTFASRADQSNASSLHSVMYMC